MKCIRCRVLSAFIVTSISDGFSSRTKPDPELPRGEEQRYSAAGLRSHAPVLLWGQVGACYNPVQIIVAVQNVA